MWEKLLQKFTEVHGPLLLILEQRLFDSNFLGAASSVVVTVHVAGEYLSWEAERQVEVRRW